MDGFEGNPGAAKLAKVLTERMKKENESPLPLDFGEIHTNGSLVTNTFPVPIPKGDYSICKRAGELSEGASVLVAWVLNEAVIIDVIESS